MSFQTWRAYRKFEETILLKKRFFRTAEQEAFLKTVKATSEPRRTTIEADQILWRSQLGNDWRPVKVNENEDIDTPCPYPPERMFPLMYGALEGRANPKGISYVYLSTERNTALAEVRPWIGARISLGTFKTLRTLQIIDCSIHHEGWKYYFVEPSPSEIVDAVWADIDLAFSKPVTQNDKVAEYAPTQILAEFFKTCSFDGLAYNSTVGEGKNIALFDRDAVELINRELFETTSINFNFEEAGQQYYKRQKQDKNAGEA